MLSVVIPTLGGSQINDTILAIQRSTQTPDEILICIPQSHELLLEDDLVNMVKIIRTHKGGQVFQRSVGFCAAQGDFVLQLDDDVILEVDCIERLMDFLNGTDEKSSIAPVFYNKHGLSPVSYDHTSFFRKSLYLLLNGTPEFQSGKISLSGVGFVFDAKDKISEVDWIPGGCALHKRQNLVLEDYYPFDGKAYSEDLIHSLILRNNSVALYVDGGAVAYIDFVFDKSSLTELIKEYRAAKYHAVLIGRNLARLRLYYGVHISFFVFYKVKCWIISAFRNPKTGGL